MLTRQQAKQHLKSLGWSYRRAAPLLGVTHIHLAYVLNGQRQSRRLLSEISEMGPSPTPYSHTGFALRGQKNGKPALLPSLKRRA